MTTQPRYRLSFSFGGLLLNQSVVAAGLYLQLHDWADVRTAIDEGNLLQARTEATGKRQSREVVQRLSELAEDEIALLEQATSGERAYLLWAATCRRYALVAEFAEEVVRERFLLLNPTLNSADFDDFLHQKAMWHPELESLTAATQRKLQTNVYLMLREAELLTASGTITPCLLSARVQEALDRREPSDLRFFPARSHA